LCGALKTRSSSKEENLKKKLKVLQPVKKRSILPAFSLLHPVKVNENHFYQLLVFLQLGKNKKEEFLPAFRFLSR
jgi:hypothetical protein